MGVISIKYKCEHCEKTVQSKKLPDIYSSNKTYCKRCATEEVPLPLGDSDSKIPAIKFIIREIEGRIGVILPTEDIFKEAKKIGIGKNETRQALKELIRIEHLFEPRPGFIARIGG